METVLLVGLVAACYKWPVLIPIILAGFFIHLLPNPYGKGEDQHNH